MKFIKKHINEAFFPNKQQMKDKAEISKSISAADKVANDIKGQVSRVIRNAALKRNICPISPYALFYKNNAYLGHAPGTPNIKLNDIDIKIDTSNETVITIDFIYGGFSFKGKIQNIIDIPYTEYFLRRLEKLPDRDSLNNKLKTELLKSIAVTPGLSDSIYLDFIKNANIIFGKIYLYDKIDDKKLEKDENFVLKGSYSMKNTILIKLGEKYEEHTWKDNALKYNIGSPSIRKDIENNLLSKFVDLFAFPADKELKLLFTGEKYIDNYTYDEETLKSTNGFYATLANVVYSKLSGFNKKHTQLFSELFSKYPSFGSLEKGAGISKDLFEYTIECAKNSLEYGNNYEELAAIDINSIDVDNLEWTAQYDKDYIYSYDGNKFVFDSSSDANLYNIKLKNKGELESEFNISLSNIGRVDLKINGNVINFLQDKLKNKEKTKDEYPNLMALAAAAKNKIIVASFSPRYGNYGKYFKDVSKEWIKLKKFLEKILP